MSIQFNEENGGKILVVHVSGKLVKEDYASLVPEVDRLARERGKLRLLIDMADFHGWDAAAAWEDLKLGVKHFADIEKIAVIGETRWQHAMASFCKPFARAAVRYFDHGAAAEARRWLAEA
ncbi:MAG: STAS/SEC14 domain-containing protein [Burkholderiales bacterium]